MQNRCRTKGSPTFVEGVEISSCFDVLWYIWYIIYFHKLRMFEHGTAACPSRPAFPTESSSLGCPAKDSKKGMNCGGCGGTPWNTVKHSAPDPSKSWYASAFWSFWPWAYEKYLWIALWIAMVYSDSEIWKVIWNRFGPYTFGLFCTRVSDVSLHFCWRDELGHHSRPRTHGLPPRFRPWKHDTQTQSQLWQLSEEFRSIAPGERPWWAYTSIGAKLNQCWSNPQPTMLYCGDPRCRMIHRIGASGVNLQQKGTTEAPTAAKATVELAHLGQCNTWPSMAWFGMSDMSDFFSVAVLSKKSKGHSGENWATGNSSTCLRYFSRFFCVKTLGPEAETQGTQGVIFWAGGFIEITSSQYQLHDVMIYVIYNHIYIYICQS